MRQKFKKITFLTLLPSTKMYTHTHTQNKTVSKINKVSDFLKYFLLRRSLSFPLCLVSVPTNSGDGHFWSHTHSTHTHTHRHKQTQSDYTPSLYKVGKDSQSFYEDPSHRSQTPSPLWLFFF